MPQTTTGATALKEPPDAAPAQASTHDRPRTAGGHRVAQPPTRPPVHRPHASAPLQGGPDQRTPPPAVLGTASPHPRRCPDSRRVPKPHLCTPYTGTARAHTPSHTPSRTPETRLSAYGSRTRARDSGNKIDAIAHGMGSEDLAVDAMAIGCLGVDRHGERFFRVALAVAIFWLENGRPQKR
jgi:hypothetical protein